jgi:lipid-A-disaccharide synthase
MDSAVREVLIVAGEASGDLHAAAFASALARQRPDLRLVGVGGREMERAGVNLVQHSDELAVMGFVEVLRKVPHHYALLRELSKKLSSGAVSLFVPIDYPGFNVRLAAAARRAGVPVLYYITPQVWAWGAGRLPKLSQLITRAAVILPFEEALLKAHGIDATFVGHPLLDRSAAMPSRAEARRSLGFAPDDTVLALFPGSRSQEVKRHLDSFIDTGRELERRRPGLKVLISAAPGLRVSQEHSDYPVVRAPSFSILRAADAALCKSGTTTLEAAVAGCPLAVAYRTSTWTHAIARRVVRIPHIGLVNVVAGREVAREFVQNDLVPRNVAAYLDPLLRHGSAERDRMLADLATVRAQLGEPGASDRVAQLASALVR